MSNVDALAKNAASMGVSYAMLVATMPKESARMAVAILIVVACSIRLPFLPEVFYFRIDGRRREGLMTK